MSAPKPAAARRGLIGSVPFYYGWLVLGAAMLTTVATLPGQTVGVAVFLDGIITDLGTNRSTVTSLYTAATLTGSLALPFVGRFLDRRGARVGVGVIGLGFAAACLLMAGVNSLVLLALGFLGLRALGQGSLGLVSQYTINQWFVRRRGLAAGVAAVGFSLGITVVPAWFAGLEASFGWRGAYAVIAGVVAAVALIAGVGIFRSQPEQYGLTPDGGRAPVDPTPEPSVGAAVARRSGAFWLFSLGSAIAAALATGLLFHHFSIVGAAGLARSDAAAFFLPYGIASAATTLLTGPFVDRFPHRLALIAGQGLLAAALWLAPVAGSPTSLLGYGVLLGGMQGIVVTVSMTVYAHLYGRRHLGEIRGTAFTVSIAASALGPLPFAIGYDLTGGYLGVIRGSALLPVALIVWALAIGRSRTEPGHFGAPG